MIRITIIIAIIALTILITITIMIVNGNKKSNNIAILPRSGDFNH